MKAFRRILRLVVLVAIGSETLVHAQTSEVSGQVRDTTHAAISGAKVTLTRVETGDRREGNSSDQGYYAFPLLVTCNNSSYC